MKAAVFVAVIGAALLLRALFPSADPPVRLSWSNGLFTDPPSIVLGARDDVRFGDWRAGGERGHAFYPLWNGIARLAFGGFGPTRDVLQFTGALWATIAVFAGALAAGRAGVSPLGAAAALGGCAWLAEFGRIPLPEHLATALLAGAAWFALGDRSREYATAGALAGVAAWFAKPQAVLFVPAAAAFLIIRRRSARPLLAFGGGIGLATALWLVTVAPWAHR
ncbi:MAG: hypothetical protein KC591_04300, partial [Gemmatimonadetes bacterium]|nr:hypothetical protein [Gemmatimonadota bacterium]